VEQAVLELRHIGDIQGQFFVARYQRGYRWGPDEVRRLLDDLWENREQNYSLQPVVVKRRGEEWELVDGQQRMTTLYLLLRYMEQQGLQNVGPMYELRYETRPGGETYLRHPEGGAHEENIDFFHIHRAWVCIRDWFEQLNPGKRQHVANKLYDALFERVSVIWYEADAALDATELFTRLNVGRIPLTDAELVKAQLLSAIADRDRGLIRSELAASWDRIEADLRHPDVWAFVTTAPQDDYPTRITLLLDTLADQLEGVPAGRSRPRFYTFDAIRRELENSDHEKVWEQVVDLHALVMGWFADRSVYHKVGFLVATGEDFPALVQLARGATKSAFEGHLDSRICRRIDLTVSQVRDLAYDANYDACSRVLLLMNVETVRRMVDSSERYPFRRHRSRVAGDGLSWSIEHIHAQHTEGLTKAEQWRTWLELHRDALVELPARDTEARDALVRRIDGSIDTIERATFEALAREVASFFDDTDDAGQEVVHHIGNLALLPSGANSKLNNAAFEVKRRRILELDKEGSFVPACTRHVFLKYYSPTASQQTHFWSRQDRESYIDAMLAPGHGLVADYLKPEPAR
jgi:hypothetical protein